jgi:hypothetical protein
LLLKADPVPTQRKEQSGKHLELQISTSKVVTWQARVDDKTSSKEAEYVMMLGMDLMTSKGITVDCEKICGRWGGTDIPLKTRTTLNDNEILHMLHHAANEPDILK